MIKRLKLNIQRFATSGSLTTPGNSDGTTFTFAWSRQSYSIADNKSTIYWEVRVNAAYTYYSNAVQLGATTVDGAQVHGGGTWSNISKGTTTLISGTKDIYHSANGTKSFAVSISGWTWDSTWTSANNSSNPFVLDTIPRYTSVTKWAMTDRTETSIILSWQTADVCSQIKYKADNGSYTTANVNSNSGSVTISGLSANASHTLYFIPKRKDSNLWGDGSADNPKTTTQSTLQYPYVSNVSVADLTIGNEQTLTISNPKSRSNITVYMKKDNTSGTTLYSGTTSGTSIKFTPVATTLYNSIKSSKTATCVYYCVWDGHTVTSEVKTKTYKVNENNCRPIFNDFTYADTNTTTVALTGDNQKVVKGYSNVTATVSVANKAELNVTYPADNMVRYNLIVGNDPRQSVPYSNSEEVSVTVPNATSGSITLNAEDSRKVIKEVPKTAALIEYTSIQKGNINITRQGNVGEAVTLTFNGTYWNNSFGSVTNTITSTNVRYRYKKTTESWSGDTWNGTTTIAPVLSGNTFSFSGGILGDTASGFNTQYSYNIEIQVKDKLSSTTFTFVLGTGIPTIAVADSGVAIKQPYDTTTGGSLQVGGNGNMISMNNNASGDTYIVSNALWASKKIGFGVGAGGSNRGIYDFTNNKWSFYNNDSNYYVNGNTTVNGTLTIAGTWTRNTSDTWIPVIKNNKLEYCRRKIVSSKTHSDYNNNQDDLATMSMLSFWNGAYGSSNASNLTYAHQGTIQCKPVSLYDNSSGATGGLTLSQTAANFTFLQFFYGLLSSGTAYYGSMCIYSPNGKKAGFIISSSSSTGLLIGSTIKTISGTSITNNNNGTYWSFNSPAATNEMRIYKVYGWK